MQVLAYPVIYSGNKFDLPLYQGSKGELILQIKFGPHVDLELVNLFCIAADYGCQWVQIVDQPLVEMVPRWINIYGKCLSPVFVTTDAHSGSVITEFGMPKSEKSLED